MRGGKEPTVAASAEAVLLDRVLVGENELFYELVRPHQTMLRSWEAVSLL